MSAAVRTPQESVARRKTRQGIVVSAARDKTITVRLETLARAPGLRQDRAHARRSSTPTTSATRPPTGDLVRVVECRPLSKQKRWRLVEILEKARAR